MKTTGSLLPFCSLLFIGACSTQPSSEKTIPSPQNSITEATIQADISTPSVPPSTKSDSVIQTSSLSPMTTSKNLENKEIPSAEKPFIKQSKEQSKLEPVIAKTPQKRTSAPVKQAQKTETPTPKASVSPKSSEREIKLPEENPTPQEELLASIEAHYKSVQSIQAHFTQTTQNDAFPDPITQSGLFYWMAPTSVRWSIHTPMEQSYYSDGKNIKVWNEISQQLIISTNNSVW